MVDTTYILMWIGYGFFGTFLLLLTGCACWRMCLNRNKLIPKPDVVIEPVQLSSNTSSNERITYYACPVAPFNPLPPGTTDGLSDFDSSILVDQPMVLSHPHPYCHQKATNSTTSTPILTSIADNFKRIRNNDETISDDEGNYSIDGAIRSFDKSILSIRSSDSEDEDFRLTTIYTLNETKCDFIETGIKIPKTDRYKRTSVK